MRLNSSITVQSSEDDLMHNNTVFMDIDAPAVEQFDCRPASQSQTGSDGNLTVTLYRGLIGY